MAELIQKLSECLQALHELERERDFYLKLIAMNGKVYTPLPDILTDDHRRTILALVREILGERSHVIAINGRASNGNS